MSTLTNFKQSISHWYDYDKTVTQLINHIYIACVLFVLCQGGLCLSYWSAHLMLKFWQVCLDYDLISIDTQDAHRVKSETLLNAGLLEFDWVERDSTRTWWVMDREGRVGEEHDWHDTGQVYTPGEYMHEDIYTRMWETMHIANTCEWRGRLCWIEKNELRVKLMSW